MTRINISITNEKTIEQLNEVSGKFNLSYASVVAILLQRLFTFPDELDKITTVNTQPKNAHGGKKGKA